jgi:bla regulator protein BlaR1
LKTLNPEIMPALFVFLLKVNVALLLFCAGYYLVLRHVTFYTLNRIYLVIAIIFATVYPKINLSAFVRQHQQLTQPVRVVVFNWQAPAESFVKPFSQPNYWFWIEALFWAGAVLLALRLLVQLYSLYKLYLNSTPAQIQGHKVRVVNNAVSPFSFWKSIYVNPANHEPADLSAILLHEQVHVNEWHTIDILLAELSSIFYWFNPGVWLMKKAIRENIEFITDRKILRNGADSKQYQYSLVSVSFASSTNTIVNHFNISTIKKRIIMMNAKRSSKVSLTRYALLVPGVVALLFVFGISKAAFMNKSIIVRKALSVAINTINTPAIKSNFEKEKTDSINNVKLSAFKVIDTLRKGRLFISTPGHSDSLNYIINGVKATKADFDALESNRIYSIEIMPAEKARKLYDQIDNQNSVLFVTTNDSEPGKKFKEKIDKLNSINHGRGNISIAGYGTTESKANIASGEVQSSTMVSTVSGDSLSSVSVEIHPKIYSLNISSKAPYKITTDTLILSKGNRPFVLRFKKQDSLKGYTAYVIAPKSKTYTLKGKVLANKAFKYNAPKVYTISTDDNHETNIEHLSAKLIMIDGKEATEDDLKKLSAADIESMSVKSGEEITKKYGDKAKNGVLFIDTKK